MKSVILGLLGLCVGWFLGASYSVSPAPAAATADVSERAGAAGSVTTERLRALEQSLVAKDRELVGLRSELAEVRSRLVSQEHAEAAEELAEGEEQALNPFMANVQSMAVESSKARKQEALEKLKRSLDLTPEQLLVIEQFYEEGSEREAMVMSKLFAGQSMETIQEETTAELSGQKYHSLKHLLKDILTPEQLETYERNQEQEALERKEANAYSQLSRLQSDFILDDDQKDAVFAIFYEKSYAVTPVDWKANGLDSSDPEFAIKSRELENDRLLEELSDALTPEQLEMYRIKLKNENEMIRQSMRMFSPPKSVEK